MTSPLLLTDAEAANLIAGDPLGKGGARTGYAHPTDARKVIKVVHGPFVGPNLIEWFVWNWIKDTDLAALFGECFAVSETGKYLVMERLDSIPKDTVTPTLPAWVRDVWSNNFGQNADGVVKIRDYANVSMSETLAGAPRTPTGWQLKSKK